MRPLLFAILLVASPALGEPQAAGAPPEVSAEATPFAPEGCGRSMAPGLAEGPVSLGYFEADVATGRRACPRTEVGLAGRLGLTVDTPNFYGAISGDALVFGAVALDDRTEVFATLEAVHHQWVQNATLKGSNTTLGQLTVGGSRTVYATRALVSSTSARLMLPTSMATPRVRVVGLEAGQAASYRRSEALEVHGYLGAELAAGFSAASADPRAGALLNLGAQWSPLTWFAVALDLNAHAGGTASYLAPALGLRFRPYRDLGAELAASLPIAGTDRHDLVAGLRLSYRL